MGKGMRLVWAVLVTAWAAGAWTEPPSGRSDQAAESAAVGEGGERKGGVAVNRAVGEGGEMGVGASVEVREELVPGGEWLDELGGEDGLVWARGRVRTVVFSPDSRMVAAGMSSGQVVLWDVNSGRVRGVLEGHREPVNSVAFAPDGAILASGAWDDTVKLWDVAMGTEIRTLRGHRADVNSVIFAPDGTTLASSSDDGTVKLWDIVRSVELRTLRGHKRGVTSVSVTPDGTILASASLDNTVRIWDMASGRELRTLRGHEGYIRSITFAPDGVLLASGSDDDTVKLWEVATGKELRTLRGHPDDVRSVAFAPDGIILASGSWDHTVKLWEVATGKELRSLPSHNGRVRSVAIAPDGATLASSGSFDGTVQLWEVATGTPRRVLAASSGISPSVAVAPDNATLVAGSSDGTLSVWDMVMGKELRSLRGHTYDVRSVAIAPDGVTLASGAGDRGVKLWNMATGTELRTLRGHVYDVRSVAFAPDGASLGTSSLDSMVKLWDVATGAELRSLRGHAYDVKAVAFAPGGAILASGSLDDTIKLWDVTTGVELRTLRGHEDGITSVAFAPDGARLASGSLDSTVKLWDVATGQGLHTLRGHTADVNAVAFTPDGAILASGSDDDTVRLWHMAKGKELRTLSGYLGDVTGIAFARDGSLLVSASSDGAIRLTFWQKPEIRPAILRASPAGWVSLIPDDQGRMRVRRHDTGGMLLRRMPDGRVAPVPPVPPDQPAELTVTARVLVQPGDGPDPPQSTEPRDTGLIEITVENQGRGRAYWIQPLLAEPPPGIHLHGETLLRLEPGERRVLSVPVTWTALDRQHPTAPPQNGLQHTLRLRVVHAHGQAGPDMELPIRLRAPDLILERPPEIQTGDQPTVRAVLQNRGDQDTGPLRVTARFAAAGKDLTTAVTPEQTIPNLAPGQSLPLAFAVPETLGRSKAHIELVVTTARAEDWSRYLGRTWSLDAELTPPSRFPYYALLIIAILVIAAGAVYLRIYRNPVVVAAGRDPGFVKNIPLSAIPEADRDLDRARRRHATLTLADIPVPRWNLAKQAAASADGAMDAFAQALGATLAGPIAELPQHTAARDITLPALTLRFARQTTVCTLSGPAVERGQIVALATAVYRNGKGPREVVALDLTTAGNGQKLLAEAPHVTFVVLGADALRDLILSETPDRDLERVLVGQRALADLSPYQTSGGVDQDNLFYGREAELRRMADRSMRSFLVVGARQMGKSSLLKALERRLQGRDDLAADYVELFSEKLVATMAARLAEADMDRDGVRDRGAAEETAEALLAWAAGTPDRPRVWLIDEADAFVKADALRDYALTRAMRKLTSEKRAYFVIAGYWDVYAAKYLAPDHPLRNLAELIELGPLDEGAARVLASEPMAALDITWEPAALDRIVTGTGRRANLVVLACKALIESLPADRRVITLSHVERMLAGSREGDKALQRELAVPRALPYMALDRALVYQSLLLAGAGRAAGPRAVRDALSRAMGEKELAVPAAEKFDEAFARLELGWLLVEQDGALLCPVPLMRERLEQRGLAELLADTLDDLV